MADAEFKPDLTAKIAALVQRYAPDKRWHCDSLLQARVPLGPRAAAQARAQMKASSAEEGLERQGSPGLCSQRHPQHRLSPVPMLHGHAASHQHAIFKPRPTIQNGTPLGFTRARARGPQVLAQAGGAVSEEVCRALVVRLTNAPELHGYAARAFFRALRDAPGRPPPPLLATTAAWVLGARPGAQHAAFSCSGMSGRAAACGPLAQGSVLRPRAPSSSEAHRPLARPSVKHAARLRALAGPARPWASVAGAAACCGRHPVVHGVAPAARVADLQHGGGGVTAGAGGRGRRRCVSGRARGAQASLASWWQPVGRCWRARRRWRRARARWSPRSRACSPAASPAARSGASTR